MDCTQYIDCYAEVVPNIFEYKYTKLTYCTVKKSYSFLLYGTYERDLDLERPLYRLFFFRFIVSRIPLLRLLLLERPDLLFLSVFAFILLTSKPPFMLLLQLVIVIDPIYCRIEIKQRWFLLILNISSYSISRIVTTENIT